MFTVFDWNALDFSFLRSSIKKRLKVKILSMSFWRISCLYGFRVGYWFWLGAKAIDCVNAAYFIAVTFDEWNKNIFTVWGYQKNEVNLIKRSPFLYFLSHSHSVRLLTENMFFAKEKHTIWWCLRSLFFFYLANLQRRAMQIQRKIFDDDKNDGELMFKRKKTMNTAEVVGEIRYSIQLMLQSGILKTVDGTLV